MSTDRELLELAAQAAGFEGVIQEYPSGYVEMGLSNHFNPHGSNVWAPFTSDGDALRLAVKLDLFTGPDFYHFRSLERFAHQDKDEFFATRRAIVRAAAEKGRSLAGQEQQGQEGESRE